jgi:hypothetical protein
MKPILKLWIVLLLGAAIPLAAQVAPEATSRPTIPISGNLTYSVRYSQGWDIYPGGAGGSVGTVSGDFGYSTNGERMPFSITFGGGDSWVFTGTPYNTGPYENLALSQALIGGRWSIHLGDSISYRKGAPEEGFAGVPGTGEPISQPNPTPTDETIETLNEAVVNNDASVGYNYKLNASSTVSVGGGYGLLHFTNGNGNGNGNGIDSDSLSVNLEFTQRLNARNSLVGSYGWGQFGYTGADFTFDVNDATIGWQRTWNRTISSSVAFGPEWLSSSGSIPISLTGGSTTSSPVPSSYGYSANAKISYNTRLGGAGLSYSHGVSGGSGYLYGGEQDSVAGSFSHQFGRQVASQLSVGFSGGYRRISSLISQAAASGGTGETTDGIFTGDITSEYGSVQATRALGRNFSVNAGFSMTEQSFLTQSAPATGDVLNGLWEVISFGVGYTPQPKHLRH